MENSAWTLQPGQRCSNERDSNETFRMLAWVKLDVVYKGSLLTRIHCIEPIFWLTRLRCNGAMTLTPNRWLEIHTSPRTMGKNSAYVICWISAATILRASRKTISLSQCGLSWDKPSASRLCSLRSKEYRTPNPEPTMVHLKTESQVERGTWAVTARRLQLTVRIFLKRLSHSAGLWFCLVLLRCFRKSPIRPKTRWRRSFVLGVLKKNRKKVILTLTQNSPKYLEWNSALEKLKGFFFSIKIGNFKLWPMPKIFDIRFPEVWFFFNCDNTNLRRSAETLFPVPEWYSSAVVG